jgi:hypothetical protein
MATAQYQLQLYLNPGFCPYYNALRIEDLYSTQNLIERTFSNETRKMITLAWQ